MAYQALYRQWRPRDFSHMVGQEAILETLRNQVISGHISHAYLFCGSRGTGKTSTAKILARAINCQHPNHGDPCGECEMCRRMDAEESLDIIEMDAASNSRVDDARDVIETVKYPPQFGRFKVYIVDEVHMMSASAFNALLKTIEEPPEHVVFILATTEPQKLPATILSRCQRFDFGRIPAAKIQGRLKEAADGAGAETTPGALMAIARAAEGGMRDALSILDMCLSYGRKVDEALVREVLGTSDLAFLFRFSTALRLEHAAGVLSLVDQLMRSGRDPLVFSKDFSSHLRALILAKCLGTALADVLDITEEDAAEYAREGEAFTNSRLMDMLDLFMKLETDLRYAASPRIALENTCLKCCLRTKPVDTLAVNDRIAELENVIASLKEQIAAGPAIVQPATAAKQRKASAPRKNPDVPTQKVLSAAGRNLDEVWKDAVRTLQKTEPSIDGLLKMGQYIGSPDGKLFRWQASAGFDMVAESLNSASRKKLIVQALTEASGAECDFIALNLQSEIQKAQDDSDEAYIGELKSTFGEEPVDVVENLE